MFDLPLIARLAGAMAGHAADRHAVIARNVAHADTPGYRAQDLPAFAAVLEEATPVRLTAPDQRRPADGPGPRWPMSPLRGLMPVQDDRAEAAPNGNSVSIEREFVKAAEARHQHDLALAILRSATGQLRSALGR
ncbi:MAG: flagellar basal body rod protein FlgB [Rhodobacteraceae bacterium]|jgi:flagellar basal-body rod protein FlgB|nr:flagellar basal body rod protein FlgB [Paracoccaceae bacterium]